MGLGDSKETWYSTPNGVAAEKNTDEPQTACARLRAGTDQQKKTTTSTDSWPRRSTAPVRPATPFAIIPDSHGPGRTPTVAKI